jgi:hypothetical protein
MDQGAESTLVSIAVLIVPQSVRLVGSGPMHLRHATRKDGQCTYIFQKWIFRRTGRADGCSITFNDKFHAIPLFQPEPIFTRFFTVGIPQFVRRTEQKKHQGRRRAREVSLKEDELN